MIHQPVFNGDGHYCSRCNVSWDQGEPEPADCLPSAAGVGTQPLGIEGPHPQFNFIFASGEADYLKDDTAGRRFWPISRLPDSFAAPVPIPTDPVRAMIGGTHYLGLEIDPNRFCMRNHLDPCVHGILKYVTRHRSKNGREDLLKARHYTIIREAYAIDLDPPRPAVITMLEYVTRNQIRPDDAEILYRLEAYYRAINPTAARIGADRLVEEIDRVTAQSYLTVDAT